MPVFRSDNFAEDKIKIKLSYSFTNFDDNIPAENSVIAETNIISEKLSILKSFLFYGFMVVSLLRIVYLMEPTSKV